MDRDKFLADITRYISKSINHYKRKTNSINCSNCFDCTDSYRKEKEILNKISIGNYTTTKEQGDALEELLKLLFDRIDVLHSFDVTDRDTALGQIDISLIPLDNTLYEILGMTEDSPSCLIGECKNYKDPKKVGREDIEKTCWRASKGKGLSFFIGNAYTQKAIEETSEFNLYRESILRESRGVYIVPITISMIKIIVENDLNFCFFIRWAIQSSKKMAIANYL